MTLLHWLSISIYLSLWAAPTLVRSADSPVFYVTPKPLEYAQIYNRSSNECGYFKTPEKRSFYSECIPYKRDMCGSKGYFEIRCCPMWRKDRRRKKWCLIPEPEYSIDKIELRSGGRYPANGNFKRYQKKMEKDIPGIFQSNDTKKYTVFLHTTGDSVSYNEFKAHIVPQEYKLSEWMSFRKNLTRYADKQVVFDGQVIPSKAKAGNTSATYKLKVTTYGGGSVFIECSSVVDGNFVGEKGLYHYITAPIKPTEEYIGTVLKGGSGGMFGTNLDQKYRDWLTTGKCGAWDWATVFIPEHVRNFNVKGYTQDELKAIMSNHVTKGLLCSEAILGEGRGQATMFGEQTTFSCQGMRNKYISAKTSTAKFSVDEGGSGGLMYMKKMYRNGIIYPIENFLIPSQFQDFTNVLSYIGTKYNINKFNRLRSCNVNFRDGVSYMVLVPTDSAFNWFFKQFPEHKRLYNDGIDNYRCRQYKYHFIQQNRDPGPDLKKLRNHYNSYDTESVYNYVDQTHSDYNIENMRWKQAPYFNKKSFGTQVYFSYANVRGVESIPFNQGAFYIVEKALALPVKLMIDILQERRNLSGFYGLVSASNIFQRISQRAPRSTMLAIEDKGLQDFLKTKATNAKQTWAKRLVNQVELINFLKYHLFSYNIWGDDYGYIGLGGGTSYKNDHGVDINFWYTSKDDRRVGVGNNAAMHSKIIDWNLFGIDGMIWIIDKPLECPPDYCPELKAGSIDVIDTTFACLHDATERERGSWDTVTKSGLSQEGGCKIFKTKLHQFLHVKENKTSTN